MTEDITLIPGSGLQFWTVRIDLAALGRARRNFWEERLGQYADGAPRVVLRRLVEDEHSGRLVEPATARTPPEADTYAIGHKQVVEMLRDQWVPLPYFVARPAGAEIRFGRGPGNWARSRLTTANNGGLVLTLAFDTALEAAADGLYNAPTQEDSQRQEQFELAHLQEDVGWFLNEGWVGDWLSQVLEDKRAAERGGRKPPPDQQQRSCEHYATYQTFLDLLALSGAMPRVQMLHAGSEASVDVDLVLDLGNSRSCGILIEEHPGQGMSFSDSYALQMRDLTHPEREYDDPFPSRIEFARASFGRDQLSRRSQRVGAFTWPSPARTGHEAVRLAGSRTGNEGLTGLSSPKRYLWDTRPAAQGWRFNGRALDGQAADPPVNGPFRTIFASLQTSPEDVAAAATAGPVVFSRSMLFTFMLVEIVLQAMMQMNAPQTRMRRRDVTRPRRLRAVMLTMPPGMPVAEQKIFRHRARTAIDLAWGMLDRAGAPSPLLRAELDEATATQIVWLHNEVTERLGGNVDAFFDLYGRARPQIDAQPSLRLASIDIGGGTTDLMVTTYSASSGGALCPRQNFRESFKIAGDDMLACIISQLVLPPIESALNQAGVADPKAVLNRALTQDHAGQSEQDRHLRRLFVSNVLEAAALAVLRPYEAVTGRETGELGRITVGEIVGSGEHAARSVSYLARQAAAAGARDFNLAAVELVSDSAAIEQVISHTLGQVIADLAEVIWHYDCDVLLLSGRPSRLRRVVDMVTAMMPVAPHRIIAMYRYRVGPQYAFRDALDRIDDPKTTVVVGAALCVQAEGRLQNFTLRTRELSMRSTARIIGKMDLSHEIRKENELLKNVDLDGPPADGEVGFTVDHFEGKTQIGFRQLPIARWPATPLYMLEFNADRNLARLALPLSVKIMRADIAERDEEARDFAGREQFRVDEVSNEDGPISSGIVQLRLQTLRDAEGYWRDTGRLSQL